MPKAIFISPQGEQSTVEVQVGWSLMEAAREGGIPGIVAECGGGAICGTCHVKVDPEWHSRLGAADVSESALLEAVPERCGTSRLACQIVMSEELDGICLRIPSEQLAF